jgi:hypothetical protein
MAPPRVGHPQVEHREMALKSCGIEAPLPQSRLKDLAAMQPLATSRDLDTLKQEIEATGSAIVTPWRRSCFPSARSLQLYLPIQLVSPEVLDIACRITL